MSTTALDEVATSLRPRDLAAQLPDVTEDTLAYWRHVGTGPAYFKRGGRVWYPIAAVNEWLEAGRRTSTRDDSAGEVVTEGDR